VGLHGTVGEDDEGDVTTLTVDALGTSVAIAVPASIRGELRAALADLEGAADADRELTLTPGDQGLDLCDGGQMVRRGVDPRIAIATVVWRLNAIAARSTAHVLLHAACVAGPQGGGVLLAGGPGVGKSTVTSACLSAGLAYLSDEVAAIDRDSGLLLPYAKPLVLDGERLVPASSLGAVATAPVAPAAVMVPRYAPGAGLTEVALDPGWALLTLAAHATNLSTLGGTGLAWLAGLAVACPSWQLTHGDAAAAVASIEWAARLPARPVEPATVLAPITPDTTTVALGDALAVLHGPSGKIHLLNPAAAAVWRSAACAAADIHDCSSLVDAALDAFAVGDDVRPDRESTTATVGRLVSSGLLSVPTAN
jgi:hypothetical protein